MDRVANNSMPVAGASRCSFRWVVGRPSMDLEFSIKTGGAEGVGS